MNRHVFSQSRAVADSAMTDGSTKREILRKIADHTTRVNATVAPHVRVAEQMRIRSDDRISTNMHGAVYHTVRADLRRRINHSIGINDCSGVNRHQEALKTEEPTEIAWGDYSRRLTT